MTILAVYLLSMSVYVFVFTAEEGNKECKLGFVETRDGHYGWFLMILLLGKTSSHKSRQSGCGCNIPFCVTLSLYYFLFDQEGEGSVTSVNERKRVRVRE